MLLCSLLTCQPSTRLTAPQARTGWIVTCDLLCVICDFWILMCDLWCVMCDLWCVECDVTSPQARSRLESVYCDIFKHCPSLPCTALHCPSMPCFNTAQHHWVMSHLTSDMRRMASGMRHMTSDMRHMTSDMWLVTRDMYHLPLSLPCFNRAQLSRYCNVVFASWHQHSKTVFWKWARWPDQKGSWTTSCLLK